jgi:hypothetical protein
MLKGKPYIHINLPEHREENVYEENGIDMINISCLHVSLANHFEKGYSGKGTRKCSMLFKFGVKLGVRTSCSYVLRLLYF